MPGRIIAIGDIHGCSLALATLLDAIGPQPDDLFVLLGDYIDRGPDSRGVLEQVISLARRCRLVPLLGNHEEMLLAARSGPAALKSWLICGGLATLESYGPGGLQVIPAEHWRFLEGCRDFFETDQHLFIHANYLPHLPLDRQPAQFLRWEFLNPLWVKTHCSGKTVLVGHTSQKSGEVLDLGFVKCIDTFCHGGKWLTALDVNTGRIWQASNQGQLRWR
jgi:serine/threonine protein phosphatase 1